MSFWSRHLGSTAIAIFITGSAATADVTARQVWDDFKSYMESFGYTVTASEQVSGDTITLSDLSLTMEMPDSSGTTSIALDGLSFTETGDGSVRVNLPDSLPIAFATTMPDDEGIEEQVTGTIDYTHSGFEMIVAGDPDDMTYSYSAAEMAFALTSLVVGAEPVVIDQAQARMTGLSGESTRTGTDLRTIAQTMTLAAMDYVLDMANPEDPSGRISLSGGLRGIGFDGTMAIPDDIDTNDMGAAMRAGFAVDGGYTYETGSADIAITGQGQSFESNTSSADGRLTVQMNGSRIAYSGTANDIALNYAGTDIPLPVTLGIGQVGFNMLVPVSPTDAPTDFALGLTLGDVTVSDAIWGMVDPAGQLPRDPATLQLDFTGKARLTQDIMDAEAMAAATGTPPGELNSLAVNALNLSIAGAALTGAGAFTFDNTDLSTFPGMPRPEGALDMTLTGGNALLDTLVAMGLLPEDQAMGARMMLGLFARPGDGPDTLTSRIEINGEGQVLANGQRLR